MLLLLPSLLRHLLSFMNKIFTFSMSLLAIIYIIKTQLLCVCVCVCVCVFVCVFVCPDCIKEMEE